MSFGKLKEGSESIGPTSVIAGGARPSSVGGGNVDAFLGKGSRVVGSLTFTGPVEIDGDIEGDVTAKERLIIGESAHIKAKVTGSDIIVKGAVHGDIVASKTLTLKKPARIIGNITAANLSIEEGVIFEGKCSMGAQGVKAQSEKVAAS